MGLQRTRGSEETLRVLQHLLPSREDALGAALLFDRIARRLDVQGAILFEPSFLASDCFLGWSVKVAEVARWCRAILDLRSAEGEPLLVEYRVDGIRYAWCPSFYHDNPGISLDTPPRCPTPPGWDFSMVNRGRPGPKRSPPSWLTSRAVTLLGGMPREVQELEEYLGGVVVEAARRYALQFTDPDKRSARTLQMATYGRVLGEVAIWKSAGKVQHNGREVPWSDEAVVKGMSEVAGRIIEGRFKSHTYLLRVLTEGEQRKPERPRPRPDSKHREARQSWEEWAARMDAWIEAHPEEAKAFEEEIRGGVAIKMPMLPDTSPMFRKIVQGKLRTRVGAAMNDFNPDEEGQ